MASGWVLCEVMGESPAYGTLSTKLHRIIKILHTADYNQRYCDVFDKGYLCTLKPNSTCMQVMSHAIVPCPYMYLVQS